MTTRETFDLEREVHRILFDVMDLTVGQEKELREKFIAFGRRCQDEALQRAANVLILECTADNCCVKTHRRDVLNIKSTAKDGEEK